MASPYDRFQVAVGYSAAFADQVSSSNTFWLTGGSAEVHVKLYQGFGLAFNTRNIRVAKNNIRLNDYQFELALDTTLNNVISNYWNLVSAYLGVDVAQQTLTLSQKLLDDNKKPETHLARPAGPAPVKTAPPRAPKISMDDKDGLARLLSSLGRVTVQS